MFVWVVIIAGVATRSRPRRLFKSSTIPLPPFDCAHPSGSSIPLSVNSKAAHSESLTGMRLAQPL